MEEDRRVPSNSDILVAIGSVKQKLINLKGCGKDRKEYRKIANNNVNQWKAIVEINTRCEERMKSENTRLSKGFTLKSILVAAIAGGFYKFIMQLHTCFNKIILPKDIY